MMNWYGEQILGVWAHCPHFNFLIVDENGPGDCLTKIFVYILYRPVSNLTDL